MRQRRVVIIGAGIGGLTAALDLAVAGCAVTVLERAATPGGKIRIIRPNGIAGAVPAGDPIDAGPTVFTMRWVFEQLFANAGTSLADHVTLHPADILARHAWGPAERLDLFADTDRTAGAVQAFAGRAEADGFRSFTERARRMYDALETPFLRAGRPTPLSLLRAAGLRRMLAISPFETLMGSLASHFADPRLRQLFGRYATYCGSSPYRAPATLMLVAHVERDGVWLVAGGMHRLASAVAKLAAAHGVVFRYGAHVKTLDTQHGTAVGVTLADGERIAAGAVVMNGDAAALPAGCLGQAAAHAIPRAPRARRSLSALTWALQAQTGGFPLSRHNVFFSRDYRAEFADLAHGRLPSAPTIYVCAQDRGEGTEPVGPERLLCLVNAPANGDTETMSKVELDQCRTATFGFLAECGLRVDPTTEAVTTTPAMFETLFPATGGALYGQAVHGPWATFRRPGSRTRVKNLFLAGGSTHPGAGVPMAALSGRLAAAAVLAPGGSTVR